MTVPCTVASIVVAGEDTPLHLCPLEHESPALVSHVLQDTPADHQQLAGCRYNLNGKSPYRLFMCQDEKENEPKDESFRSFWIKPVTNEPGLKYYDTLKDLFVRHA